MKAHQVQGDSCPVLITFICAWGPPNDKVMEKIVAWFGETIGLKSAMVIGLNPWDGSSTVIWPRAMKIMGNP